MLRLPLFFALFTVMALVAPARAQSVFDQWPALATFHGVMSQTFHPAEEGNLAPIRARSGEMAEKAALLAKADVPATFDKPDVRAAVTRLRKDSRALDKLARRPATTDAQLTAALTGLHDVFHQIVGLCREEHH